MIWRGLWVMWMRVSCAACVETCWSAPSRRPVNMPTAAPASAAGSFITAHVPKTDCRWMWAASNHYTGPSTSLHMCLFLMIQTSDAVFNDRYMRNDLTRLQIRCVNAGQGCEVVCSLESLHAHEDECQFAFVSCSNTGMNPHSGPIHSFLFMRFLVAPLIARWISVWMWR